MVSLIMILEKDCCVWRQAPVIVKVKVWRKAFCIHFEGFCGPFGPRVGENMQFWGFLLGESTYFIGFMLPTFGIICKLGGFCGPFGPRVWKFAFFDIILLKLKYLPSMSCDIEGRRHWGQIFLMYRIPALKVVCPQSRLPSKSSALKVVCPQSRLPSKSWAQRRGLNVACPQCPIVFFWGGHFFYWALN